MGLWVSCWRQCGRWRGVRGVQAGKAVVFFHSAVRTEDMKTGHNRLCGWWWEAVSPLGTCLHLDALWQRGTALARSSGSRMDARFHSKSGWVE